ncbi:MAG: DUF4124 domain-containing protein [Wenzhouxiangella sp.]
MACKAHHRRIGRLLWLAALAAMVGWLSIAQAQVVYRWTDEHGNVHYGHAVPPEHAHRGFDRLGRDGRVRERVERALTPEEIAERDARLAREAELAAEQARQDRLDQQLLSAYASEADIESSLNQQIATLDRRRATLQAALEEQTRRFENLVSRAAALNRDGQPVPAQLNQSIEEARNESRRLRGLLAELDEQELAIRARFAADLARFQAIQARSDG